MTLRPWTMGEVESVVEVELSGIKAEEPTEAAIDALLADGAELQSELSRTALAQRLEVLEALGEVWSARTIDGELSEVRGALRDDTGYSASNIDLEMRLVPQALKAEALMENIEASLQGGAKSVDGFAPLGRHGEVRNLPAGPVLILASGNSIIPGLVPTAVSLAMGNFTVVKPSAANYRALVEVFEPLREMSARSPAANLLGRCLVISYFTHDSPRLSHLLEKSALGAIDFWGGEPGRTRVMTAAASNPHRPRPISHGPLTGVAIISAEGATDSAAKALAENIVLYEQQLCSSPTIGAFIGSVDEARRFADTVATELDRFGSQNSVASSPDGLFVRGSALKVMELNGSTVMRSKDGENAWSLVLSPEHSRLDKAVASFPGYGLHGRRRFIELVVVPDMDAAADLVRKVPGMAAFRGVDRVQTVGVSLSSLQLKEAMSLLPAAGIYRIIPLEGLYMRDAAEPYDGAFLASLYSYTLYRRRTGE